MTFINNLTYSYSKKIKLVGVYPGMEIDHLQTLYQVSSEFRPPKKGELAITEGSDFPGQMGIREVISDYSIASPRLILDGDVNRLSRPFVRVEDVEYSYSTRPIRITDIYSEKKLMELSDLLGSLTYAFVSFSVPSPGDGGLVLTKHGPPQTVVIHHPFSDLEEPRVILRKL